MSRGFYDQPASGGGGPQSGQTRQQVLDLINSQVAAQALAGNRSAWPASKVTVGNSDTVAEGSTNLYFTTERALSAAEIPLTLGAVTGGSQWLQLRSVSHEGGNAIDVPSGAEHGAADGGFLLELNGFMAQVPFDDLNELPVNAANNTTVDTSGNSQNALLFRSPDTDNGVDSIYVGLTSAGKLLLSGSHNDGSSTTDVTDDIKLYPMDHARHGTFNRDDPVETTIADDDHLVFFDTSGSFSPPKRITGAHLKTYMQAGGGGGGGQTITASVLEGLIDDSQGNVDATLTTDNSKIILTATVTGGGGGTFTLTQANLRPVLNNTLLVDSTLNKTVDTTGNTITLGVAASTTPSGTHTLYAGHQASLDFSSWATSQAENTYDVSASGSTVATSVTQVPDDDYVYYITPQDREPVSIIDGIGAENINDFAEQVGAVTISGVAHNVYTKRNTSGITVPNVTFTITTE